MQRMLYLLSITALFISMNSGLLGECYHQNSLLGGAANLLMLILSYRLIYIEIVGAKQKEGVGNVISSCVLQNMISMEGWIMPTKSSNA